MTKQIESSPLLSLGAGVLVLMKPKLLNYIVAAYLISDGVLRLMAAVIHELWARGDQSLLILPGTLPLDAASVRNELLRYLPRGEEVAR